jgi:hypothetical protein
MNKDSRDDTMSKPSEGGTVREHKDVTDISDAIHNDPIPVSKVEDAKETPGAAKQARDKQIGSSGGLRNTN